MIQEPQICDEQGSEPHFDDERTISSARPVIPLGQIQAKSKYKRIFFLLAAFTLAVLLGMASGLISAYFHLRAAAELRLAQEDGPSSAEPEATVPIAAEESLNGIDNVLSVASPVEVATKRVVIPTRRPVISVKRVPRSENHALASQPLSEAEELRRIRDAILTDGWQEKRMRRTMRRERHSSKRNETETSNL